ncbi:hypothetical protein RRG08_027722 [Elysia crispata]|uniref:Uncharacterized protein n=1 Tax=Elysia crispata TaxID=231223 RepID=A0AAE1CIR0_9GAST|nr:hypothetical protein RRG08_027722 [Elysia crispata]
MGKKRGGGGEGRYDTARVDEKVNSIDTDHGLRLLELIRQTDPLQAREGLNGHFTHLQTPLVTMGQALINRINKGNVSSAVAKILKRNRLQSSWSRGLVILLILITSSFSSGMEICDVCGLFSRVIVIFLMCHFPFLLT